MPTPPHPTSLLHAPSYGSSPRPEPTRVAEPVGGYAVPRAVPSPTLTVRPNGDVTLSKPLVAAVPRLRGLAPVDVVPPMRRGGIWHLDARPTAPRRLPAPGKVARFNIGPVRREHLLRTGTAPRPDNSPAKWGTVGTVGTVGTKEELVFALGPEVTEEVCVEDENGRRVCQQRGTGYFELLPVR